MIRSMTGFGAAASEAEGIHHQVEIRSLNGKYFKVQVRVPEELQSLESALETRVTRRLGRGSVILTVRMTARSAEAAASINVAALQRYLEQLGEVRAPAGLSTTVDLAGLLELPGVMSDEATEVFVERSRAALEPLVETACDRLVEMRRKEGAIVLVELDRHLGVIAEHLAVVARHVPQIIDAYQARLRQRMEGLLAESGAAVREEDLLREVAVFAERSDIAEEVARLQGHIQQFRELVDGPDDEPIGRTLDFIAQEMLREANTIGSKCLDVEVARRIVEIKGSIDRIKEQVQNVE